MNKIITIKNTLFYCNSIYIYLTDDQLSGLYFQIQKSNLFI